MLPIYGPVKPSLSRHLRERGMPTMQLCPVKPLSGKRHRGRYKLRHVSWLTVHPKDAGSDGWRDPRVLTGWTLVLGEARMGEGAWPRSSGDTGTEATDLRPTPLPGVDRSVCWPAWPVLQEDGHLENECYNFPDFQVTREPGVEAEVGGPRAGTVMLVQCPCTGLPPQGRRLRPVGTATRVPAGIVPAETQCSTPAFGPRLWLRPKTVLARAAELLGDNENGPPSRV